MTPILALYLALLAPQATTPVPPPPLAQAPAAQPTPQTADVPAPPSKETDWAHTPCAADASGVYRGSIGLHEATVIYTVDAVPTKDAEKMNIRGNTLVSVIVDKKGKPQNVHTIRSITTTVSLRLQAAALPLDQRAVEAVSNYRFRPATCNGKRVPVELVVETNFDFPRF